MSIMTKRSSFAPIGAGIFALCVCVAVPAEPALAQSGGGGNSRDVRVINTPSEPVPVAVQSLPAVQIGGTPTVLVGNNVPVTVTNLPAAPGRQRISLSGNIPTNGGSTGGFLNLYTVPEGKVLSIEFFSFNCNADADTVRHRLTVTVTGEDGLTKQFFFVPDGTFPRDSFPAEVGSKQVQIFAAAGSVVFVGVSRTTPYSADPSASIFTNVAMTGHLLDAQ